MTEISFKLEQFEGPLDLLLHLISKHKLNIYDISITILVEQYLDYIEKMNEHDMEVTGDFLEMAARLIYIKTVSLLPKHDEADVMKKELEGRLIEHSLCKRAAEILSKRYCGDDVFVRQPLKIDFDNTYRITHEKEELFDAWMGINIKKEDAAPVKIQSFGKIVSKRMVSVTSKIIYVLRKLYTSGTVMMNSLYVGMSDKSERVATFLAILELTKAGRITISDDNETITFNGRNKEVT
ncbi:MAG: segregation/condensation protein A [Oscillospiraceae bacterium]|nr:segregation/condensation protein A [Oscillospiraceae bacterium]